MYNVENYVSISQKFNAYS